MREGTGLRRELGLRDLTLFAITGIVSTRWISSTAHAGPGSVTLLILGEIFFAVPLAITVAALIVRHPGGGGLYRWTRDDFGPWHGFLAFWVYWVGIALLFPSAALFYTSIAAYMFGPQFAHLANNRIYMVGTSLAAIWIALGTNLIGMKIGKWTENIGGAAAWVLGALFAAVAALVWIKRGPAAPLDIAPVWNWSTLSFWSVIAYALSGIELAGFMDAEIRDPERNFPRAAWISSGFILVFYVVMTLAMVVLLAPEKINEINGLPQTGTIAAALLGTPWLPALIAILVLVNAIGVFGGMGTAVSRLPMAAGADRLLPEAFGKIHPRWGTPYVSLITFGVVASFLLVVTQFGDTLRAAYESLVSLMVIVGFLPYLYMFGSGWKAGKRISAVSGCAVTLFAIVCAVAPTAEVTNVWLFELKLALGTAGTIASAWFLYTRAPKSRV